MRVSPLNWWKPLVQNTLWEIITIRHSLAKPEILKLDIQGPIPRGWISSVRWLLRPRRTDASGDRNFRWCHQYGNAWIDSWSDDSSGWNDRCRMFAERWQSDRNHPMVQRFGKADFRLMIEISMMFSRQRTTSGGRSHSNPRKVRSQSGAIRRLSRRSSASISLSRTSGEFHCTCRVFLTECNMWVLSPRQIDRSIEVNVLLVLPETIMIVGNELLSNLSLDNGGPGELECRTSVSNPQAQLKVTRRSADGQEHADIQYKTASSFRDGINSIKFLVCDDTVETSFQSFLRSLVVTSDRFVTSRRSTHLRSDNGHRCSTVDQTSDLRSLCPT